MTSLCCLSCSSKSSIARAIFINKYAETGLLSQGMFLATAYLLLIVETGAEEEVMRSLKSIEEVKEARMVYGAYDIIIRVETETMEEMKNLVNGRIRRLDKIRSTMTMIVV